MGIYLSFLELKSLNARQCRERAMPMLCLEIPAQVKLVFGGSFFLWRRESTRGRTHGSAPTVKNLDARLALSPGRALHGHDDRDREIFVTYLAVTFIFA
jgi:hypothetical protein